jgi:hypothetical protein
MKTQDRDQLLKTLQTRFEKNMQRHKSLAWKDVQAKLAASPKVLEALRQMEATGGEPDVVRFDKSGSAFTFCDCSAESPLGRRSLCYDQQALLSRKENRPSGSVLETAATMGVELLSEEQYRQLQQVGDFDTKTSSWVLAPPEIRALGGGIFCDKRYGRVFVYHNGPQSYYASRGFRALLRV